MGETTAGAAGEAARLEELAGVTREYAKYSRSMLGFAEIGTGAWLLAALWARRGWSQGACDFMVLVSPLVWLGLIVPARRYYQRHGEVMEYDSSWFQPASLFLIWTTCVLAILNFRNSGLEVAAIATLVAVPVLAARITRGGEDGSWTAMLVLMVRPGWGQPNFGGWVDLLLEWLVPGLLIPVGAWKHWRYRRLERRLAALKGAA